MNYIQLIFSERKTTQCSQWKIHGKGTVQTVFISRDTAKLLG